jgi:hypothetical protein
MPAPSSTLITSPRSAPGLGDPAYSLLSFVAGTLLQVGTQATAYVSSLALVPRGDAGQAVAA